jgi:hypothetical protein
MRRALLIAAMLSMLPWGTPAAPRTDLPEGPTVVPAMVVAEASCASLCRQRHNQCRIATRGAARCDAELQRCLKGCIATKRR